MAVNDLVPLLTAAAGVLMLFGQRLAPLAKWLLATQKTLVNPIDNQPVVIPPGPASVPKLHELVTAWETLHAARHDRPDEYGEHLQYVWGVLTTPRKEALKP
jgi:hypothetical protein